MPSALVDLLFWIAVFVVLFFVLRFLQKRKGKDRDE